MLLLAGEENIGISCLLKKTAAYLIARESGKQSRKWVYLDLKDCRSILQVLMSSQIRRNKHTFHGLREVLSYLRGASAVIVLDHCDKVAYGSQFQDLLNYMKSQLTIDSKIMLVVRTSPEEGRKDKFFGSAL